MKPAPSYEPEHGGRLRKSRYSWISMRVQSASDPAAPALSHGRCRLRPTGGIGVKFCEQRQDAPLNLVARDSNLR